MKYPLPAAPTPWPPHDLSAQEVRQEDKDFTRVHSKLEASLGYMELLYQKRTDRQRAGNLHELIAGNPRLNSEL